LASRGARHPRREASPSVAGTGGEATRIVTVAPLLEAPQDPQRCKRKPSLPLKLTAGTQTKDAAPRSCSSRTGPSCPWNRRRQNRRVR
jgi:hypothetical protein